MARSTEDGIPYEDVAYDAIVIEKESSVSSDYQQPSIVRSTRRPATELKYCCSYDGCDRLYTNMSSLRRHTSDCQHRTIRERNLYAVKNMNMRGGKNIGLYVDYSASKCLYTGCSYTTPIPAYLRYHMLEKHYTKE